MTFNFETLLDFKVKLLSDHFSQVYERGFFKFEVVNE